MTILLIALALWAFLSVTVALAVGKFIAFGMGHETPRKKERS